jgi:hypothetical protein
MTNYNGIRREETLKSLVHEDYFPKFGYEPNIDNIDFVITDKESRNDLFADGPGSGYHYLWAEAKKGVHDVFNMFTQLVLTCKKTYEKGEHLAPPWLAVFDEKRICFAAFHDILPVFTFTDFNWNTVPSNHETADFQKAREKIKDLIGAKIVIYHFDEDDRDIKDFINNHFTADGASAVKRPITRDNFVQIFIKWVKEVKPYINIEKELWTDLRQKGILDCDFYRADMMSLDGNTITDKLKIILKNDNYELQQIMLGLLFKSGIGFTDGGEAYSRFWNRYERPPLPVYQQYIIDRRDLLVPQNIREVKGSFFTPKIWGDKSKEYLARVFGENWQEEYYVWDCAAGTGNLLAGLTNKYNLWASDIDEGNVETMHSLIDIDENLNLLPDHVFKFDFLNDDFDKLPWGLRDIISGFEKRRKLIVYINPPYAEAASATTKTGTGKNKQNVVTSHMTSRKYKDALGRGINELFANFFIRIYREIPGVKLASFSTLKYINSQNFIKFRMNFLAEYKAGFICRSDTFDNVKGSFPVGFLIWDFEKMIEINSVKVDIYETSDKEESCRLSGTKTFYTNTKGRFIVDWIRNYFDKAEGSIGYLRFQGTDFQTANNAFFTSSPTENDIRESKITYITKNNLYEICIYLAARHCIQPTWINDRDQFLFPNEKYKSDIEFKNDCFTFSLFHSQNKIKSADGVNHWIPFTEAQVDSKHKFASNFMSGFLKKKTFSAEAQAVFDAGHELWKYYHAKIKNNRTASVNASLYDIREFFQGRNAVGTMNTKSSDETYNVLIKSLREKHKKLAKVIEPKIYEYGFLKR